MSVIIVPRTAEYGQVASGGLPVVLGVRPNPLDGVGAFGHIPRVPIRSPSWEGSTGRAAVDSSVQEVRMTPRTRFLNALGRRPTDCTAVGNPTSVITTDLMDVTGRHFPEAHTRADEMASLSAAGYEILGYDTIAPYFSVQQEAAALGCAVDWGDRDHMPTVRGHPFEKPEDIRIPAGYLDRLPIRTVLDALRMLKQRYGQEVALVGKVMGPWTLAYHLFGIEAFLIGTIDAPGRVAEILERLLDAVVLFGQAQIEAGADCLTLADHLTGDLCRAETYRDFLLPVHQQIGKCLDIHRAPHLRLHAGQAGLHRPDRVRGLSLRIQERSVPGGGNCGSPHRPCGERQQPGYALSREDGTDRLGGGCSDRGGHRRGGPGMRRSAQHAFQRAQADC